MTVSLEGGYGRIILQVWVDLMMRLLSISTMIGEMAWKWFVCGLFMDT